MVTDVCYSLFLLLFLGYLDTLSIYSMSEVLSRMGSKFVLLQLYMTVDKHILYLCIFFSEHF